MESTNDTTHFSRMKKPDSEQVKLNEVDKKTFDVLSQKITEIKKDMKL